MLASLILFGDPGLAATIRAITEHDLDVILVQGELTFGDERKFIDVAIGRSNAIVALEGPGGNLHAGIEIGRAIRLKGFSTAVIDGSVCASACALAWLGGRSRVMQAGARVGFHSAWKAGPSGEALPASAGNALVGAYLNQLGLSPTTIFYLTEAPPDGMTWLSPAGAKQAGLDFSLIERGTPSQNVSPPSPPLQPPLPPAASSRSPPVVDWTVQGEWVQVASRAQLADAILVAVETRSKNSNTAVFQYANGWYGVVIGPFSLGRGEVARAALVSAGEVPADSLVTRGGRFAGLEWGSVTPRVVSEEAAMTAQAIKLSRSFYATWSSDNFSALSFLSTVYDNHVVYFGRPSDKDAILTEKARFAERWSRRRYMVRDESLLPTCEFRTRECTVIGIVDWEAIDPRRALRSVGSASFELTMRLRPGEGVKIIAERSQVTSRERTSLQAREP